MGAAPLGGCDDERHTSPRETLVGGVPWTEVDRKLRTPKGPRMALLDSLLLDPAPFEVWITKRTDGLAGSGTLNDPWDGRTTVLLDSILSHLPANTPMTVHFGPGTF